MQIEVMTDEYSCPNCYYEMFDETAFPCSRCIHNKPDKNMFTPKMPEQTEVIRITLSTGVWEYRDGWTWVGGAEQTERGEDDA